MFIETSIISTFSIAHFNLKETNYRIDFHQWRSHFLHHLSNDEELLNLYRVQ